MSTYQEKKKKAREKAIEWQERFAEQSISCDSPDYFNQLDESAVESLCENRRHIPTIRKNSDLEQLFNELEAFD